MKCKNYESCNYYNQEECVVKTCGLCMASKDLEVCTCGGDPSKCDFYESKRKESETMIFAEMWLEAQNNDKWYINKENQIVYNNTYGLVEAEDLSQVEVDNFDFGIESIMRTQWKVWEHPIMTKVQAEEKYGIKIID